MSRLRAHSDPASPPHTPYASLRSGVALPHIAAQAQGPTASSSSSPRYPRAAESSTSSLQSSLSNLTLTAQTRSPLAQFLDEEGYTAVGRRSETPSVTSVSDEGDEDVRMRDEGDDERTKGWVERGRGRGKGKGKERESGEGIVEGLPLEVLTHIMKLLHDPRDLFNALQVSRTWCLTAYPLLWCRPSLTHPLQLASLSRTLVSPSPSLPYATSIRRLNLSMVSTRLNDDLIDGLEYCTRVDRLTITNAEGLSTQALKRVLGGMRDTTAVDLSGTACVENSIVRRIGEGMDRLQGLNITGCKGVGDEGLKVIAERRKNFRRLKVGHCHRITDLSIVPITRACPLLIEMDLSHDPQITDASLYSVFLHLSHLRELRLVGNGDITARGIPNLAELAEDIEDDHTSKTNAHNFPWYTLLNGHRIMPRSTTFEHLRIVDLMSCAKLDDEAVDNLIWNAPKIRHLVLAKCPHLTDRSLESIARLGRHLHHLHLGHAALITDAGVTKLARACTRLRYIDVACCPNITDLSVLELAENLQKMRRIGLVKATHITDEAIYALVERHATLERIHLSYCDKISVKAIAFLLNRLLRLTHLSLTGVAAFKVPELQQFCRPTPSEFTESQRDSFCVYSGHGIGSLRKYLNLMYPPGGGATSDEGSRRGSGSSQSSLTGPADPPQFITAQPTSSVSARGRREAREAREASVSAAATAARAPHANEHVSSEGHGTDQSGVNNGINNGASPNPSRIAAPVFRYASRPASRPASPSAVPGLPGSVLAASSPNFFGHPGGGSWSRRPGNAGPASNVASSGAGNTGVYGARTSGTRRRVSAQAGLEPTRASDAASGEFARDAPGMGGGVTGSGRRQSEIVWRGTERPRERERSPSEEEEEEEAEDHDAPRGGAMRWVTSGFGRERR